MRRTIKREFITGLSGECGLRLHGFGVTMNVRYYTQYSTYVQDFGMY